MRLAAAALLLGIALPAAAQEFKPPSNLFGQKKATPVPPKIDWSWRRSADASREAKPAVVCGMTTIPADPMVDPKMRTAVPESGVTFKMRVVPPTVCKAP